jgi:CheY-like chemotaxis protein
MPEHRTILFVDDDESLRGIVARALRALGREVVEAESAEDAVALLDGGLRPGLVLLDRNLPSDTGWGPLR